jgi:transcriptional antiterminator
MTKLALAQMLMPVAKMLIEKLFDMFKGDTNTYDSSAKTSKDTDAFLKSIEAKLPEVQKIFEEKGIDFKTSGKLDTSADVQKLIDALTQLKDGTNSPAEIAKIDKLIESLSTARDQLKEREDAGTSTGKDDFVVSTMTYPPGSVHLQPSSTVPTYVGGTDPRAD